MWIYQSGAGFGSSKGIGKDLGMISLKSFHTESGPYGHALAVFHSEPQGNPSAPTGTKELINEGVA